MRTSRTGACHWRYSSGSASASSASPGRGAASSSSAASGPATSVPRRVALLPTGVGDRVGGEHPSAYRTTPARSARSSLRGSTSSAATEIRTIGQQRRERERLGAAFGKHDRERQHRRQRGPTHHRDARAARAVGAPALAQVRRRRRTPRRPGRRTARRPGWQRGQRPRSAAASPGRRRWSASAVPTAGSSPNANVSRPVNRFAPSPRRTTAPRARRPRRSAGTASDSNSAALDGCAIAAASCGVSSAAERREQHAVARHVVAAVPPVVPDPEPLGGEQLGAEQVRGQVLAARARRSRTRAAMTAAVQRRQAPALQRVRERSRATS